MNGINGAGHGAADWDTDPNGSTRWNEAPQKLDATQAQSLLGRVAGAPRPNASDIEVVEVPPEVGVIEYYTSELSALCPVTNQPDQYEAVIRYQASGGSLESKALKHYLWSFRDRGIFCETLAAEIAASLSHTLGVRVTVKLRQQVRGGLTLSATAVSEPTP